MTTTPHAKRYAMRVVCALESAYQQYTTCDNLPLRLRDLATELDALWDEVDALHNALGDAPALALAKAHLAAYEGFIRMLCGVAPETGEERG